MNLTPGLAILGVAMVAFAAPAGAQSPSTDPTVAPTTSLSADGRTVTDGVHTLSVDAARDLDPAGATISITGSGYDEAKGVYVAFCVVPALNQVPTPCGGGAALTGGTGASQWVSSNPPSYGEGLAVAYGPGGTFTATLTVAAQLAAGIDCTQVPCAVVTRNDHTRTADRSQDLFVPVTFRSPGGGSASPPTTASPTPTTAPAVASTTTTAPRPAPPTTVVDDDGRVVSDGTRRLEVSAVAGLDAEGDEVTVEGDGYDDGKGIYVALCAVPEPGEVPGPCRTGSVGASAWISSNPPDYGRDLAEAYGDGGSFTATLELTAVIDADTDCRQVECAVVTRNDDSNPDDRSQDLFVPVSFGGDNDDDTAATPASSSGDGGSGGGSVPWLAVGGVVVVAVAASTPFSLRRRERKLTRAAS